MLQVTVLVLYALYAFWGEFSKLPALFVAWMVVMTVLGTAMNYFWFYKIGVGVPAGVDMPRRASGGDPFQDES